MRVNGLLSLVAQGRQDEAEVMIEKDPRLLLERGDVTDGAGRTFTHITALQTAVWALDAHMWTMMLPYFDQINARCSAGDQLRLLEQTGTAHGRHFDFKPLLDAYGAYLARPSAESWCRGVGVAQRALPDHVIQEYTTPDRPFKPVPDFSVQHGRPGVHGERGVKWWRTARYDRGTVGETWGAWRGQEQRAQTCAISIFHFESHWAHSQRFTISISRRAAGKEQATLHTLCSQRERDLSALLAAFSIMPSQAPESKSPGRR